MMIAAGYEPFLTDERPTHLPPGRLFVPLDWLVPNPENPREVDPEKFENLKVSIGMRPEFLLKRPVLASDGPEHKLGGLVYAGNSRWAALRDMYAGGRSTLLWPQGYVPVDVSDLDRDTCDALLFVDNSTWGSWSERKAGELLKRLEDAGTDTSILGLDDAEVKAMLKALEDKSKHEDDADLTPPAEPITKRGDLWLLGGHRLLCADARNPDDVARLMEGARADIVLTDPPYGMDLDTDFSTILGSRRSIGASHGIQGNTYRRVAGDDSPFDPAPLFDAFGYCAEMFLFGADYYAERIPNRSDGSWLVWDKRKESQAAAVGAEFELIWSRQRHKRRMLRHDWFGFLSSANGSEARNRQHPTQKPTSLLRDILEQWSPVGALVVDLYLGSGSTLVAAEQSGRRCYGSDIDAGYIDVCVRRWQRVTGHRPLRVRNGSTEEISLADA